MTTTTIDRERAIREAFHGAHDALTDAVAAFRGYEWGGRTHAANCLSLSDYRAYAATVSDDELDGLLDL